MSLCPTREAVGSTHVVRSRTCETLPGRSYYSDQVCSSAWWCLKIRRTCRVSRAWTCAARKAPVLDRFEREISSCGSLEVGAYRRCHCTAPECVKIAVESSNIASHIAGLTEHIWHVRLDFLPRRHYRYSKMFFAFCLVPPPLRVAASVVSLARITKHQCLPSQVPSRPSVCPKKNQKCRVVLNDEGKSIFGRET
jgi:hypothetical protein